jgi:uncharacterized protein (DUF433 family)
VDHLEAVGADLWWETAVAAGFYPFQCGRGTLIAETEEGGTVFDRITFDPKIIGGRACIRGMRIPVSVIVSQVAHGASVTEILQEHPDLEPEDIQQALEYAAWLTREEVRSP